VWILGFVCAGVACGQALAPASYEGKPRASYPALVTGTSALLTDSTALRGTLLWLSQGPLVQVASFDDLVEQPSSSVAVPAQGGFLWNFFDEPEARHRVTTASGAVYGLARPVAYEDRNHNGVFDPGEPVVGVSPARLVLWAPAALSAADSPTGVAVPPGFHIVSKPIPCAPPPPPPPSSGTCGVPLGRACAAEGPGADAPACNGGYCLFTEGLSWPGGACALPDVDGGCRPDGSVRFAIPHSADHYWVQGCDSDADCAREQAYQCDFAYRACVPTRSLDLVLSDRSSPISVCATP
jgi:hypothetical protein